MTISFTCIAAWIAVLITLPLILFAKALETPKTRINRLRKEGWTWRKIAAIYGVSETTVSRWAKC